MTRKAILIGNNTGYQAPTFLKGVDFDLRNYYGYLQSGVGGGWNKDLEIKVLHNKGRRDILSAINTCFADYSFVVFSGHGYIDSSDGLTRICVSDGIITEDELNTQLTRQTLILDCCREVTRISKGLGDAFEKAEGRTLSEGGQVGRRIIDARKKFDAALSASSAGIFTGYACSVDETSGDNPTMGGVFSTALLNVGKRFGSVDRDKISLTIRKATIAASQNVTNDPFSNQIPTHKTNPQKMELTAPFAITNKKMNLW
jgi:hypothetical protein